MSLTSQLPALQVVVPLLTAPLVILLRGSSLAWVAATAASIMAFLIAAALTLAVFDGTSVDYEMGGWPAPYGIQLHLDSFNALLLLLTTGASTLSLLGARSSIGALMGRDREPLFYAAWLVVLAGLCGIAITGDAFNVFVFMEISSLATYVLVAAGPERRALTAAFKYLIMGTIGATFYLIGIGMVYMMTGTLNFADLEVRIAEVEEQRPILVAAGFITIGLALKVAIFPLHVWLPNAYANAPHLVSAFIAACSTKIALYVLLRFDFFVFQGNLAGHAFQFSSFLAPLAVLGILVGSAVAVVEPNLKRMLAYSSIAQLGYILLGASFNDTAGMTAAITHMFNHGLAKGAFFLGVAALATQTVRLDRDGLAGLGRKMPWTAAAVVIAGASLVGVPGTAGFISKWLLLLAALEQGPIGMTAVVVIVAGSIAAFVYVWRIIEPLCLGQPETDHALHLQSAQGVPPLLLLALWLAALANLYFGLVPDLPVTLAGQAADELLRHLL